MISEERKKGWKMGSIKRHWHKAVFKRNGE
jgi:hypothetical protein